MKEIDYSPEFMLMLHIIDEALEVNGRKVENAANAVQVINDSMIDESFRSN